MDGQLNGNVSDQVNANPSGESIPALGTTNSQIQSDEEEKRLKGTNYTQPPPPVSQSAIPLITWVDYQLLGPGDSFVNVGQTNRIMDNNPIMV